MAEWGKEAVAVGRGGAALPQKALWQKAQSGFGLGSGCASVRELSRRSRGLKEHKWRSRWPPPIARTGEGLLYGRRRDVMLFFCLAFCLLVTPLIRYLILPCYLYYFYSFT